MNAGWMEVIAMLEGLRAPTTTTTRVEVVGGLVDIAIAAVATKRRQASWGGGAIEKDVAVAMVFTKFHVDHARGEGKLKDYDT